MKNSIKKIAVILLAASMLGTTLVGCTGGTKSSSSESESKTESSSSGESSQESGEVENFNATGYPIVNEPITLKIMGQKEGIHGPWEDMAFFKELTKKTNINFEFQTFPAEAMAEKKNLAFVSGEYPDIFLSARISAIEEVTYGSQQKIFANIQPLIEKYGTNINEQAVEFPAIIESVTHSNGEIYTLPTIQNIMHCLTSIAWFNQKWADNLGLEAPKTTEDLYTVLKAFKDEDANGNGDKDDEIPSIMSQALLYPFGMLVEGIEATDDGVVKYNPQEENYKHYLEYCAKLYKEGLIDSEQYTQTDEQITAKGNADRLGLFAHAAPWLRCLPEKDDDYIALQPLTSEFSDKQQVQLFDSASRGSFAISSTNKYPEASVRLADYWFSEEGQDLVAFGPEGLLWDWKDDTKEAFIRHIPEGMTSSEEFRGTITPDCGGAIPYVMTTRMWIKEYNDKPPFTTKLNDRAETLRPFAKSAYPQVYFTPEQAEEIGTISVDVTNYQTSMAAKFITGEISMDKWGEYVNTLKKMKVDRYVEIHQEAYDAIAK